MDELYNDRFKNTTESFMKKLHELEAYLIDMHGLLNYTNMSNEQKQKLAEYCPYVHKMFNKIYSFSKLMYSKTKDVKKTITISDKEKIKQACLELSRITNGATDSTNLLGLIELLKTQLKK